MSVLVDPNAEAKLLSLIAEEGRMLGAPRARALLEALGLQASDFSVRQAVAVFEAFTDALARSLAPTRELLAPELLRRAGEKAKWEDFVPYFKPQTIASSEETRALAVSLKNLASRRRAYDAARRIMALAETGEAVGYELAEEMHRAAAEIPGRSGSWSSGSRSLGKSEKHIRAVQDERLSPNVPTGYRALDEAIGGLQPTLCVFCGRAGMVKSGVAAGILRNVARRGKTGAVFSLEDPEEWLGFRYLAHDSNIPQGVLRNCKLTGSQWERLALASTNVRTWVDRILVDERPGLRPGEVLTAAREAFTEHDAAWVLVDNMTAMRFGRGDRRDLDIQEFLTGARALANEFTRPFAVIAHTHNREGTKPGDIPRLADCREAPGAFENLARLALGVARHPEEDIIDLAVLKTQIGRPGARISIPFRPQSALLEDDGPARAEQRSLLEEQ